MSGRVDAHQHIWDLSVREQTWMVGPELDPVRDPLGELTRADPGQQVEERAQVPGAGAVPEQASLPADDAQGCRYPSLRGGDENDFFPAP